jgi:hypothetical protein
VYNGAVTFEEGKRKKRREGKQEVKEGRLTRGLEGGGEGSPHQIKPFCTAKKEIYVYMRE